MALSSIICPKIMHSELLVYFQMAKKLTILLYHSVLILIELSWLSPYFCMIYFRVSYHSFAASWWSTTLSFVYVCILVSHWVLYLLYLLYLAHTALSSERWTVRCVSTDRTIICYLLLSHLMPCSWLDPFSQDHPIWLVIISVPEI